MEEEYSGGVIKKFLYVNRRAPHGSIYALESLETVLIGAAFDQDVSVLFVDDGVYQLKKDQQPEGIEFKKIYQDSKKMIFINRMRKGTAYPTHKHPNHDERLTVLSGMISDGFISIWRTSVWASISSPPRTSAMYTR